MAQLYQLFLFSANKSPKKPRKHADPDHQRDTPSRERFECNGMLKITIDITESIFQVHIIHERLHPSPSNHSVPDSIKDFIKKTHQPSTS